MPRNTHDTAPDTERGQEKPESATGRPNTPARPGAWRRARWVRVVRPLAAVLAALCVAALATVGTLRNTVLDRGYYQHVLDEERAYDRLYDEVLVAPEAQPVTRSLLARLPVPESVVTANLKTVLPPATVRELTDEQIAEVTSYLRGEKDTLSVSVDLSPVLANMDKLAEVYLGGLVSQAQGRDKADFPAAVQRIDAALDDVAAGRRPADLPTVDLSDRAVRDLSKLLLSAVPEGQRTSLRPQIEGALGVGDVATALAAVGPHVIGGRAGAGADEGEQELLRITEGGRWDVVKDLDSGGVYTGPLEEARGFTRLALGRVYPLAVAVGALSVAFLWLTGPRRRLRRLRVVGWSMVAGGLLTAGLFRLVQWKADGLWGTAPGSWPPSLAVLVEDLESTALKTLTAAGASAALTPVAVGALLAALSYVRRRPRAAQSLSTRGRTGMLAGLSAVTTTAVVLGVTFVPAAASGSGSEQALCNGSARACDLRYDQAAYVATHNSMSTTADRFISPLQDGDITAQLDSGARALLVDTHTWERPDQIAERLKVSEFAPEMRDKITGLIDDATPTEPGLWLCHAVCRGGAIPLVDTLRDIRAWLDEHPGEVVTLIVQDGITGKQTESAFRKAGLEDLLFTPDDDPKAEWPTLGKMIEDDKRLVVFAEHADGPAPWYRNFYRYGMETPYAFSSPEKMSCAPNRGGTGKGLFLMNHFITSGGGSRIDAREVNAKGFVLDRARRCEAERDHPVNFVAVDFANLGDAAAAVDTLNAGRRP
ncbi:PI-PLC domain-containing protein [Streptomyces sp. NPDC006990]|uniref:PI-PLC domain-containing protein n=1 Tax=unclassified Streptomyces TaxID=2593676 RepID=UPI0034528E81